jgi:hypothetical protein
MKMKIKKLSLSMVVVLLIVFGMCLPQQGRSQEYKPESGKWLLGGGLGMQFGDVTLIEVSPTVAYRVTERFVPGISLTYQYYKYKIPNYEDYETNVYGSSLFMRYYLFQDFFAHAELMYLNYERSEYDMNTGELLLKRVNYFAPLIGGGYRQWFSPSAAVTISVLFNMNETLDSPYQNPIIRVGFQIGL